VTSLLRSLLPARREARSLSTVDDYAAQLAAYPASWGGVQSMSALTGTYGRQVVEPIPNSLEGYARGAYESNGIVFACMAVRMAVFSTVRFQWQSINRGRPSELFGNPQLTPLEQPWQGGTTQDLLTRMIQDADLAGNSYWTRQGGELVRLRPDWTQIVMTPRMVRQEGGVPDRQAGWRKVGYVYWEGGVGASDPGVFLADEVAHFAPSPDPLATYRGMSWLTPVLREIQGDGHMERHRNAFFENAATPNLSVSLAKEVRPEAFKRFIAEMDLNHKGVENAYKTLYLGGGADVQVIGADFQQMDFTKVQGHAETRIAASANVPPVIVGLSEGLQAATYSNYGQARRRFADGTMHPLWQNAAGSLAPLLPAPATNGSVRLWYDARDVPFLREDRKDAAAISQQQASTIRTLIEAGYEPDSVVRAVTSEDYGLLLGEHTGLASVQLQPPATGEDVNEPDGEPGAVDDEENSDA
jgi:phage portal protein BeeE